MTFRLIVFRPRTGQLCPGGIHISQGGPVELWREARLAAVTPARDWPRTRPGYVRRGRSIKWDYAVFGHLLCNNCEVSSRPRKGTVCTCIWSSITTTLPVNVSCTSATLKTVYCYVSTHVVHANRREVLTVTESAPCTWCSSWQCPCPWPTAGRRAFHSAQLSPERISGYAADRVVITKIRPDA